jgi:hypothetical protein
MAFFHIEAGEVEAIRFANRRWCTMLRKSAHRRRKRAPTGVSKKFTIQYVRKGKHTKPLTFDLSSFEEARKLARIAGEFKNTPVQSFTITSEDSRTERWFNLRRSWKRA